MDTAKGQKPIRSFVLGGILLGLLAAGAVVWGLFYCGRVYRSGVTASVDGTIRADSQGTQTVLQALPDCAPASVISDRGDGSTQIGLTFIGLSEEEEVNAAVIGLVKEHRLKATFALSAKDTAEHPDAVQALLDAGGEIISNGIAGETDLHRSSPEELVHSMFKSRESISTGTGQRVSLLYCSGTALTSEVLRAARASGYQAVLDPDEQHLLDETSFPDIADADCFVSSLHGSVIVALCLRGPAEPIQYEPPVAIQKPAVDKMPDIAKAQTVEIPPLHTQLQWLAEALEAHQLETEYVSRFPAGDGLEVLKQRAAFSGTLAPVYRSVLTSEPLAGVGIAGLPAQENLSSGLSRLKQPVTFFLTGQEPADRQEDILRLSAAGCSFGTLVPASELNRLSPDGVFDRLYEAVRDTSALPGYSRLLLIQKGTSEQAVTALRAAARQLGLLPVQPDNPAEPVPGALYLVSGIEYAAALQEQAEGMEWLDLASALRRSGIPALPSGTVSSLRSQNAGEKPAIREMVYAPARQVGFAFYGMTNPAAAADVCACLEANNASATFFVTLNELENNANAIESLLKNGNELGICYRASADYPQTFSAVTNYLSAWNAYAQWRYGATSSLVFLRLDTPMDETLEAIHASGCQVAKPALQPLKKVPPQTTLSQVPAALEAIDGPQIARGSFVFFRMDYFTADRFAAVGESVIGKVLDWFFRDHIDTLAYRSETTGLIEDESRFRVTSLRHALSAPDTYTLCTEPQTHILEDKHVLASLPDDGARSRFLAQRYIGSVTVTGAQQLPGFSYEEIQALDRQGTFTNDPVLFLTFDDWGTEASLNPLLYVLEKQGVKATFFIRTNHVSANPNLLRAIAQQGHQIACHTNNHIALVNDLDPGGIRTSSLTEEQAALLRKDLVESYEILWQYTGDLIIDGKPALSRMFRPPTLAVSKLGLSQVLDVGFDYSISGDYSTGDYEASGYQDMLNRLTWRSIGGGRYITIHNGSVIVMHMQGSAKYTAQALDEMIPKWRSRGYEFARIDDYLGS